MSWDNLSNFVLANSQIALNIIAALSILFVGWVIASFFRRRIRRSTLSKRTFNDTLRPVLASLAYYFIILTALYAALRQIGVEPTTLLAAFGAAGLAIALALKDTLANIAAGVMLLFVRSLQVGDYVELPSTSGTIEEIGLFSTNLRDSQGIAIYVPNNIIWSNRVQNYNRHGARKAIINIVVSYNTDLKQAQTILMSVLRATVDIKTEPTGPEVYVTEFLDRGANISCRLWLPGDNWTARTSDIHINLKQALDKAGIKIATYQAVR
ncbi:MAG: mechanosensitive ion channel family protein [Maricaulaceae bacterium]